MAQTPTLLLWLQPSIGLTVESLHSSVHSTLNQTGNTLALLAQPFHADVREVGGMLGRVPYHLLIFLHGLYTSASMRPLPLRPYWLLCFWTSLMSGYGGGTLTNLILQEPFLWLRDDLVLPLFALAWWMVMYSPWDLGYRAYRNPLVKVVCRSAACVLRARVIMSRLELSARKFGSHALVAPLFFGTFGGFAGKLSVDFVLIFFDPTFRPPEIMYPGWFAWSGFLISAAYMGTVHWLHILPEDVAFVLVVTTLVAHGIMEEVLGHTLDLSAPFSRLVHAVTRIPRPPPRVPQPQRVVKTRNGVYEGKRKAS